MSLRSPQKIENKNEITKRVHEYTVKLQGLVKRLEEKKEDFKKCPKCNRSYSRLNYCIEDGALLVGLSYDSECPTLNLPSE